MTTNVRNAALRDEELRLALVMSGGVSLAVWMGGVAYEINRFIGETHPVYKGLLELTATRARVDVISGASAGGINGAALALAAIYDRSLLPLRDLWISKGAFSELLRSVNEKDPPSLLDGDGYFLNSLEEAFRSLTREQPRYDAAEAPMHLSIATTMLHGVTKTRFDVLGERIEDCCHRAPFVLKRSPDTKPPARGGVEPDPFQEPARLALARIGRASASFPGAFEPRFCKSDEFGDVASSKDLTLDRYLIDGGVLDNKPIDDALEAIFDMPARGNVRRVLAFVMPDPASTGSPKPDKKDEPPPIAEVAVSALVDIPAAQSISDQFDLIDEHNTNVRRRRHTTVWLLSKIPPSGLASLSDALFQAYRARRIDGLIDRILEKAETASTKDKSSSQRAFGRRTCEWLKAQWTELDEKDVFDDFVPNRYNAWTFDLDAGETSKWSWGAYPISTFVDIMLDLLRRTQQLSHLARGAEGVVKARPRVFARNDRKAGDYDEDDKRIREAAADRVQLEEDKWLGDLWKRAYEIISDLQALQNEAGGDIELALSEVGKDVFAPRRDIDGRLKEDEAEDARKLLRAVIDKVVKNPRFSVGGPAGREARCLELVRRVSSVMKKLGDKMDELVSEKRSGKVNRANVRGDEWISLGELESIHDVLFSGNPDAKEIAVRLLRLEVVSYSIAGRPTETDATVELVQISAAGQSPWGGPAEPENKLTGMQLAHFGAFYRSSWRANDWMMGRLDAISRLLRIALNTDRLQRLYGGRKQNGDPPSEYVYRFLHSLAVKTAVDRGHRAMLEKEWIRENIISELKFLDVPGARTPEALPACCEALARRLHLEVLCTEFMTIAKAALRDNAAGAGLGACGGAVVEHLKFRGAPPTAGAPNSTSPVDPRDAIELFSKSCLGDEKLIAQVGSDSMTRMMSQTVTVAHGALSGKNSGLIGPATKPLQLLKLPVRLLHFLAAQATQSSGSAVAAQTTALVGGVLLLLGSVLIDKWQSPLAIASLSLLLAWSTIACLQQKKVALWALLAGIAVLLLVVRQFVFHDGLITLLWEVGLVVVLVPSLLWAQQIAVVLLAGALLWWSTGRPDWRDVAAAACSRLEMTCSAIGGVENALAAHGSAFVDTLLPCAAILFLGFIANSATRKPQADNWRATKTGFFASLRPWGIAFLRRFGGGRSLHRD